MMDTAEVLEQMGRYDLSALYDEPSAFNHRLVGAVGDGGGYTWNVFLIYRDNTTGALRWWSGQGCSCNRPMDALTDVNDLATGTERECLTDLRTWVLDQWDAGLAHTFIRAEQAGWYRALDRIAAAQKR